MRKTILFDLDGTLTDSGEGIINCATLALNYFNLPIPDAKQMRTFVGPPLHDTFYKFGVPADKLDLAVEIYRSRYNTEGKFENHPYDGVYQLLEKLKADGCRLLVATSKPEDLSVEIMTKFDLAKYFDRICGASIDRSRNTKEEVIAYLLEKEVSTDSMVMVGDTEFDVIGAASHGIPCIGVSWGYGAIESIKQANPIAIADNMGHLYEILKILK